MKFYITTLHEETKETTINNPERTKAPSQQTRKYKQRVTNKREKAKRNKQGL